MEFTTDAPWTASVAATRALSWITVSPTNGPAGSHTLTIQTTANDTPDERNAMITLKAGATSKSFVVSQKQKDALTVTSGKIEMKAAGGVASIEVKANVSYEYEISADAQSWISRANTRALKTTQIDLQVAENETTSKREGTITIRSGELTETVTIYQEGVEPSLVLSQNEYAVGSEGETIKVELQSNVDYTVQLPSDGWITEATTRGLSSHTHYYIIAPNDTYDARTAVISFVNKENNIEEKVTVTQMQQNALVVAKNEYTIDAAGGKLDFSVNTNMEFSVTTSADWVQQVNTRGLTEKPLHFVIAENTTDAPREATITLTAGDLQQVIAVKQTYKPVFSIDKQSFDMTVDGGSFEVHVTATGDYTVQLPDVEWITETATRAATTRKHTFNVSVNDTYDSRKAEILFTHTATGTVKKVGVLQAQQNALVVAEKEYTFTAAGGNLDLAVNTNINFTVTVSADWIQQVGTRVLSEKPLHFTILENTSDEAREGTITLKAGDLQQVVIVKQAHKPVFSIDKQSFDVAASGGNIEVNVTATGTYTVQLPNVNWITETTTRGATTGKRTFAVAANGTYDARSAEITFTHSETGAVEKVTVTQAQVNGLAVSQKEYSFDYKGGNLALTASSNVEYSVSISADWITQAATRGLTEKTLNFTVAENTSDEAREGTITLKAGDLQQVVTVKQAYKPVFSIDKKAFDVAAAGGNIEVNVTATGTYTVQLPNVNWITETTTRGTTTGKHTFAVAANGTYDARSAEITFTHSETGAVEKVTVTQAQLNALTVSQKEYSFEYAGGNLALVVNSNVEYSVSISADWITQSATRGLTEKTLNFTVAENASDEAREATITLKAGDLQQVVTVKQKRKPQNGDLDVGVDNWGEDDTDYGGTVQ